MHYLQVVTQNEVKKLSYTLREQQLMLVLKKIINLLSTQKVVIQKISFSSVFGSYTNKKNTFLR